MQKDEHLCTLSRKQRAVETLIDNVVGGFLAAIQSGTTAVAPYGLGAFGVLVAIAFYMRQWPLIMSSGAGISDVLAHAVLMVIGLCVTLWILTNVTQIGDALFQSALTIGLQAGGTGVSADQLRSPSFLLSMHKLVTKPLEDFIQHHTGWSVLWNGPTVFFFWVGELVIFCTFVGIALHVALIQIEFYLAILSASVFLPCLLVPWAAFLGEWCVGWVLGCTTRVLLISAVAAIGVPVFQGLALATAGGGDPTWIEGLGVVTGSLLFGLVAWFVPGRAANMVGSGLGLSASLIAGVAASSMRWLAVARSAIAASERVVSPLLRTR